MRRKIYILFLIIIVLGLITSCSDKEEGDILAVVSNLEVIEKGKEEPETYWIIAIYPDKSKSKEKIKIFVKDENVWNLIDINRKYTVHYAKNSNGVINLYEIERLK